MTNFRVKRAIILSDWAKKNFFQNKIIYNFYEISGYKKISEKFFSPPPLLVLLLDPRSGIRDG
jgi:hypothetical protein